MLNFRYHVISITAIFLAIALGIAFGVGLAPSLDSSLTSQAAVDREQVIQLRRQIDQQDRVNAYSEAWSQHVDTGSTRGALASRKVALVALSGAPRQVLDNLRVAVEEAGGVVTANLSVRSNDISASTSPVSQLLSPADLAALGVNEDGSTATQLGELLGATLGSTPLPSGVTRPTLLKSAETIGLIDNTGNELEMPADLILVVGSDTTVNNGSTVVQDLHTDVVYGIAQKTKVVVAGPNSTGVVGTDLGAIRNRGSDMARISTVDTADLASGQLITILVCHERLADDVGNYGASVGDVSPFPT